MVPVDILDCAVNRFFYDYSLPESRETHSTNGVFDYIPPLFYDAPPKCSLKQAIYAVALANFDRRTGCSIKGIRTNIDRHYGSTLRLVAEESQNPKTANSDELLLAVQMLGVFESMSTGGNNVNFLQAHAMGMAALIRQRGLQIITDEYQWRIFRSIQGQLLAACLKLGVPSFIPYSDLKDIYNTGKYPMARMLGRVHLGVDLLALWKAASDTNDEMEKAMLLPQITTLDAELAEWEHALPEPAQYLIRPTPRPEEIPRWIRPLVEHPGMPSKVHIYDSVQVIYLWTLYRTLRVFISKVLLLASLRNPIPGYSIASRQSVILRMTEDACRSVLAIFTQKIDTKPHADTLEDVVGFRSILVMMPLNVAKETLRLVPETPETILRLQWIQKVYDFTMCSFLNANRSVVDGV